MRHKTKQQLRNKDLLIAEEVVKNLIKQGRIKEATDICIKKKIDPVRFGELASISCN